MPVCFFLLFCHSNYQRYSPKEFSAKRVFQRNCYIGDKTMPDTKLAAEIPSARKSGDYMPYADEPLARANSDATDKLRQEARTPQLRTDQPATCEISRDINSKLVDHIKYNVQDSNDRQSATARSFHYSNTGELDQFTVQRLDGTQATWKRYTQRDGTNIWQSNERNPDGSPKRILGNLWVDQQEGTFYCLH